MARGLVSRASAAERNETRDPAQEARSAIPVLIAQHVALGPGSSLACARSSGTRELAQSTFAPDVLTIADHLVSSRSMSAAYSSGVDASGSAPSSARRDLNSSEVTAARSAALRLSMIGRGVPAGATIP